MADDGVIERRYEVHCQRCGRGCLHLVSNTKREAEQELYAEGWGKRKGLWVCGVCIVTGAAA